MTRAEMRLLRKLQKLLKKRFEIERSIAALKFKLGEMETKRGVLPDWKRIL